MGLIEKIKNLFKKPVIITETSISKIDTDLLFIPSFEELSANNQVKVLQYVKEVNIKDLDTIINYTKNLDEEANFNSEFLLRLYYRLTDTNLNDKDLQSDEYQTIIEINELTLCKNELLKLREEGILRILALKELYKQETSRNLTFAGIFGRFEKVKRGNELKSLEDLTERLKISVKVIEQLIQVININVDANTLKASYQDNLLKLVNKKDFRRAINDLVLETTTNLKIFLPELETKFNFNQNNIEDCLMNLSIARRLLDLYAYKHKDDALSIIDDINELCNNARSYKDNKIIEDISFIERKYQLFAPYLHNNELVNETLKKMYKVKFLILNQTNFSFQNLKNKFELSCYEEIVSNIFENILKGNIAFFINDENLPKFSNDMQTELTKVIIKIIKYNHQDLSPKGILNDQKLLKLIISLSTDYEISFQKRRDLIIGYRAKGKTLKKQNFGGLIPYIDDLEYLDERENKECEENILAIKELFEIFIDYECYNNNQEMPCIIPIDIEITNGILNNKSLINKLYLNILQNSELCIILPGVKRITASYEKYQGHNLNDLPVSKVVLGNDLVSISNCFQCCPNLKIIDATRYHGFHSSNSFRDNNAKVIINYNSIKAWCFIFNPIINKLVSYEPSGLEKLYNNLCQYITDKHILIVVDNDNLWCINTYEMFNKSSVTSNRDSTLFWTDYASILVKSIETLKKNPSESVPGIFLLTKSQKEKFPDSIIDLEWEEQSKKRRYLPRD